MARNRGLGLGPGTRERQDGATGVRYIVPGVRPLQAQAFAVERHSEARFVTQ